MTMLLILALALPGQVGYWDGPVNVGELNTPSGDHSPNLSPDGLHLTWSSGRGDLPGYPMGAVVEATRLSRHHLFGPPTAVVNPLPGDGIIVQTGTLAYSALYLQSPPGTWSLTIFEFRRPTPAAPWGSGVRVPEFIGPYQDQNVSGTADGLRLIFSRTIPFNPEIFESERPDLQSPWSPPILQGRLNSPVSENQVGLSPDGLMIVITRPSQNTSGVLFHSRRRSRSDPWSPPALIAGSNLPPTYSSQPTLSGDGLELFFHSNRLGRGGDDLWRCRWVGLSHENPPRVGRAFLLHARHPQYAGRTCQFGMALSSTPGIPIPGVGTVPLNPDALLLLSTSGQAPQVFQRFQSVLDSNGEATATIDLPPDPALAGLAFSTGAVFVGPGGIEFITNGVDLRIIP